MQFAEIYTAPGDIRELHWHINSGEWVYVKNGTCQFTLMDNDGRYNINNATMGDVWYFPRGWQHSFQAVDPVKGCTTLLWFDTSDVNIDFTHTFGELPADIIARSLINTDVAYVEANLQYPLYPKESPRPRGIVSGDIPTTPDDKCKGNGEYPCTGTLKHWPVFPMRAGKRIVFPDAGVEYQVKDDLFPATRTMSGGLLELREGALREIHWHPNAEEQHYVLKGAVRVTVYGVEQDTKLNMVDSFVLREGDVGIVPLNYIHYAIAVGGNATVAITFNSPNWKTQTLSQSFVTTPKRVTAATFGITEEEVDRRFPQEYEGVLPPVQSRFLHDHVFIINNSEYGDKV